MTKSWYQSKIVWFNALTTIVAIALFFKGTFPAYAPTFVAVSGVGNIILRIWFTSTSIS